jgi:hypothetical protein
MTDVIGQFGAWRTEIEAELCEARTQLDDATASAAEAEKHLLVAQQHRTALTAALAPLAAPKSTVFGVREPDIARALTLRDRDANAPLRVAEAAAVRARSTVIESRRAVDDFEIALTQLEQLVAPANYNERAEASP